MSLAWRKHWSRARRLTWDEAHTRLRQEFGKRFDAGFPRLARRSETIDLNRTKVRGEFFFTSASLPERVRLLKQHLPAEAGSIVSEADNICRHRFRLLGFSDLDYGPRIDWHRDAVHGKVSPLMPWHKIDFFDFAGIGDHKIIWELNRHQHLVTLAKAWLLSGADRYPQELISQWYQWQQANPYPLGINWASSLEAAFRSLSWIWVDQLLLDCPQMTEQFRSDLLRGLAFHGRYIERYLSTYFSPNTHLLGEAVALFFIGVLYPQISSADRWKKKGLAILLDQAERQVRADGVYFEQSFYYHVYALDLFLHARLLAARNQIDVPANFDRIINRMLAVVRALAQNGPPHGFGDDDGGRLFNSARNLAAHLNDPLAIGGAFFNDQTLCAAAPLTEESIWLLGAQATSCLASSAATASSGSTSFPDGGLYVSADSGNIRQQIVIDAGPLGAMRGGHGHADALSVNYSVNQRPFLVDAGSFCYMSSGDERDKFRGTGAHNTLRVDELDQAQPDGPFAWKMLPSVHADSWISGDTFSFFSGHHEGYLRLSDPVVHRRFVFHLYENFWLVRDVAEGNASHLLETFWHFHPQVVINRDQSGLIFTAGNGDPHVAFVAVTDPDWECALTGAQFSPIYGVAEPAQALRYAAALPLPAEHALVVHAADVTGENRRELRRVSSQPGTTVYEYFENGLAHVFIFRGINTGEWNFSGWESDAEFFYYRAEAQRTSHLIACNLTRIRYHGEQILSAAQPVERFEHWERAGKRQASSSDPEVLKALSDTALASLEPGVIR